MSFRELRTFTETMRLLGYSRTISVESFRTPNVELVADILFWLVKRYEPAAEIIFDIEKEQDRVRFFRQVCETVLAKGRIKLNIKKLYQSDGYAVQEMLKLATVLKQAAKLRTEEDADYTALQTQSSQRSHEEGKIIRQLCADLTNDGSSLFFLVEQEIAASAQRNRVVSRGTDVGEFERRLKELLQTVGDQVAELQQKQANLASDESTVDQKIESKKAQLERAQKRLKSLLNVRPAFMEEYDKYQAELHQHFVRYLERYRNLEYLEHQLAIFNKYEDELLAEQETKLRVMREKLRKDEIRVLRGEAADDGVDVGDLMMRDRDSAALLAAQKAAMMNQARVDNSRGELKRPRAASGRTRPGPSGEPPSHPPNSMFAAGGDDDSDDSDEGEDDDTESDGSLEVQPVPGAAARRKLDSDEDDSDDVDTDDDDDDDTDDDDDDDDDDTDDSDDD